MQKLIFTPLFAGMIAAIPVFNKVELNADGILNEYFWQKVPEITDFRSFRKHEEKHSTTSVKICLDQQNLYMGIVCDEPVKIVTGTPGSTSPWSADGVEIFLGSLGDKDWYRQIVFALNGAVYCEFIRENEFRKAVKINEKSWSAEVVIPRDKLGDISGNKILFNMFRNRIASGEMQTLADVFWAMEMDKYMTLEIFTPPENIVHAPWNTQVTDSSAVICWETAGATLAALKYREQGSAKFQSLFADIQGYTPSRSKKLHTVKITGLKPGTVYEYLINDEVSGTFSTLDPDDADFSFTVSTDTHGRSYQLAAQLQQKHVQESDLFFHLGDTVSGLIGRNNYFEGFLAPICQFWSKPFYVARGNHETRGNAPEIFADMLFPDGRKTYTGFLHKGVYFLILDAADEFDLTAESAEFWAEQQKWLQQTVQLEEFKNAKFRVLMTHFLPYLRQETILDRLLDSLPEDIRNSFDLALAGHLHCNMEIPPGSGEIISNHPKYSGTAPAKILPFPRLITFGGTFCVKKSSDNLTVIRYDADGREIDRCIIPGRK